MQHDRILLEYDELAPALLAAGAQIRARLHDCLSSSGVKLHALSHRLKDRGSLARKLARPDKTYGALWDVTDLLAFRVTVYFEDAIDEVAKLVEGGFTVDYTRSVDKLRVRDHGHFGYRSLHYVCAPGALDGEAAVLPSTFHVEIQIRTVLQHAWAEVEHDLGYKAEEVMPERVRRRFSRIASLLEIADEEFVSIRKDLMGYAAEIRGATRERSFSLDVVSLETLAESPVVRGLDERLGELLGKPLSAQVFFPHYLVRMLRLSGLSTTEAIYAALDRHRDRVLEIVPRYFEFTDKAWALAARDIAAVDRAYSLFFLAHVAILAGDELGISKVGKLAEVYRELDYPDDERTAHEVASAIAEALG